jgi:hypothetical protein
VGWQENPTSRKVKKSGKSGPGHFSSFLLVYLFTVLILLDTFPTFLLFGVLGHFSTVRLVCFVVFPGDLYTFRFFCFLVLRSTFPRVLLFNFPTFLLSWCSSTLFDFLLLGFALWAVPGNPKTHRIAAQAMVTTSGKQNGGGMIHLTCWQCLDILY